MPDAHVFHVTLHFTLEALAMTTIHQDDVILQDGRSTIAPVILVDTQDDGGRELQETDSTIARKGGHQR